MSKADDYRTQLHALHDWDAYLLEQSGLPGPRGNIELAQVVADLGELSLFRRYLAYTPQQAPVNSPYEFLAFCGALGLGRLLAEGDTSQLMPLRALASDPRWRTREAVAMALQRLGDSNMDLLITTMLEWSQGSPFEQRAAAAALCEPRLLAQPEHARAVLQILDSITTSLAGSQHRGSDGFIALRKGLGYCWSVAVVASPVAGKALMEKWFRMPNPDIQWVMKENLKKARLARLDSGWVEQWHTRLPMPLAINVKPGSQPGKYRGIEPQSRSGQWLGIRISWRCASLHNILIQQGASYVSDNS
jgi:hypothetical protein